MDREYEYRKKAAEAQERADRAVSEVEREHGVGLARSYLPVEAKPKPYAAEL